jgi:hypothetical protein
MGCERRLRSESDGRSPATCQPQSPTWHELGLPRTSAGCWFRGRGCACRRPGSAPCWCSERSASSQPGRGYAYRSQGSITVARPMRCAGDCVRGWLTPPPGSHRGPGRRRMAPCTLHPARGAKRSARRRTVRADRAAPTGPRHAVHVAAIGRAPTERLKNSSVCYMMEMLHGARERPEQTGIAGAARRDGPPAPCRASR